MNSSDLVASDLGCSCSGNEIGPFWSCSSSSGVFRLRPATKKINAPKSAIPPTTEPTAIPAFAPELSPELCEVGGAGVKDVVNVGGAVDVEDSVDVEDEVRDDVEDRVDVEGSVELSELLLLAPGRQRFLRFR